MRNSNAILSTLRLANLQGAPEAKSATLPSAVGFSYSMEKIE
jgi:hypothetical protein